MNKKIEKLMTKRNYILTAILLMVSIVSNAQIYNVVDTLDEEDYMLKRDTMKMSRQNPALRDGDKNYGTDYVIDDRYLVSHEQFGNGILENVYVSGGVGFDFLQSRTEGYNSLPLTQFNLAIGKNLSIKHSLRLSLGAATKYLSEQNYFFTRGTVNLDYLYDITTQISGYNAARPLSVSLLTGIGANLIRNENDWKFKFIPDLHAGLQFRIYTGPRCYLNIEPYAGISSDQYDGNSNQNWRKYDVQYGLNMNIQYYLFDQLSSQSKLRLLQGRGNGTMMVDEETVDAWRTPWFIEAAMGPAFSRIRGEGISIGSTSSMMVGRWLSPVLGFRIGANTRSNLCNSVPASLSTTGFNERYYANYKSGRLDFLINPFGFSKDFIWDEQFGANIVLGTEMGMAEHYRDEGEYVKSFGQTFTGGIHLWTKLTDDLQFYIEPRFTHTIFTKRNHTLETKGLYENIPSLNVGLTMLIRSHKFHELDEFDEVQNFMHSYVRGFRFGGTGGLTIIQPEGADYGGRSAWNGNAYLEYRFSHLHSVRAEGMFLTTKRNKLAYDNKLTSCQNNSVIASLDYEVSVTNLLSGILRHRWCELEAFAGPSAEFAISSKGCNETEDTKKVNFGGNFGLKLSKHIWNGISLVATPTVYFMEDELESVNGVHMFGCRFYQTLNVGVQYKLGSIHRNATKVRMAKLRSNSRWAQKQQKKLQKEEQKLIRKNNRLENR